MNPLPLLLLAQTTCPASRIEASRGKTRILDI